VLLPVALCTATIVLSSAASPPPDPSSPPVLPAYTGPKPPWPYKGYDRFPAVWFGQNRSGLDNATQMDLEAKHQIVGWGWQQNFDTVGKYTSNQTTGTGLPCNKTSCGINGTLYQQEVRRLLACYTVPNLTCVVCGLYVCRLLWRRWPHALRPSASSRLPTLPTKRRAPSSTAIWRWQNTTGRSLLLPSTTQKTRKCFCTVVKARYAGRTTT
jgi:hypothetical protein